MNKEEVIYDSDICYHQMFLFNCICFCNKKWVIECWINCWLFLLLCRIKCGWIFYHTTKWVYSGAEGQIRLALHFSLCSSMRCHGAACKFAWSRGRFPSCGSLQKIKDTNQPLSTYLLFPWHACKVTFKPPHLFPNQTHFVNPIFPHSTHCSCSLEFMTGPPFPGGFEAGDPEGLWRVPVWCYLAALGSVPLGWPHWLYPSPALCCFSYRHGFRHIHLCHFFYLNGQISLTIW